jgi:mannitol-1-phosphate/altronate dehydrogenase
MIQDSQKEQLQEYATLRERFPNALTKHQITQVIKRFFPSIPKEFVDTMQDSLDFHYENGRLQERSDTYSTRS